MRIQRDTVGASRVDSKKAANTLPYAGGLNCVFLESIYQLVNDCSIEQ